jgi:hypothetical protein
MHALQQKNDAAFLYHSEPGEYIGQGRTGEYKAVDTLFKVSTDNRNKVRFTIDYGDDHWNIEFAAPKGQNLRVGNYGCATRCAFHLDTEPGFTMSGCGRGSNNSFAGFIIRKLRFNNHGDLVLVHMQFAQRSERTDAPTLFGELYYRNYKPSKKKATIEQSLVAPIFIRQNHLERVAAATLLV